MRFSAVHFASDSRRATTLFAFLVAASVLTGCASAPADDDGATDTASTAASAPAASTSAAAAPPAPLAPAASVPDAPLPRPQVAGSPTSALSDSPPVSRSDIERSGHPVLDKLLRSAAVKSEAMLEQENLVAQNDAFRWRGWRQYMPFLNGSYQGGQYKIFKSRSQNGTEMFNAAYSLSARYPIFTWWAETAEKNAALLREKLAQSSAVNAWTYHTQAIRREFFNAVQIKGQLVLQEQQIELEKQRQRGATDNLAEGMISETERLGQSVSIRELQFALDSTKIRLANSITLLRTLSACETLTEADIPLFVTCPVVDCAVLDSQLAAYARASASDTTREDAIARTQREILDDEITQARARLLPNVQLIASITQSPTDAGARYGYEMRNILFVGIGGSWNLFDRDITNTTIRSLKTRQQYVDAKLRATKVSRLDMLRNLIIQIRSAQSLLAIRREYEKAAVRRLEGLEQSLALGLCRESDVQNAKNQLATLRQNIASDEISISRSYYEFQAGIEQDPAATYYTTPSNE